MNTHILVMEFISVQKNTHMLIKKDAYDLIIFGADLSGSKHTEN